MSDLVDPPTFNLEPRREWWGVYSVRAHMDLRALAREVLLYDRLVLPTPENLDEADRFDRHGWNTHRLAWVAGNLGELVRLVPWNAEMREKWHSHMEFLAAAGTTAEGAAYGATPLTFVNFVWEDVQAHPPADGLPPVPRRIVAAYLSEGEASADFGIERAPTRGNPPTGSRAGVLLTRVLEVPDGDDDEGVFFRALGVAKEPEFAARRRALYDYEDRLIAEDRVDEDIDRALRTLLSDFAEATRAYAGATKRRIVSRVIAGGSGAVADHLLPGAGKPVEFGIERIFARFPTFTPGPNPAGAEHTPVSLFPW